MFRNLWHRAGASRDRGFAGEPRRNAAPASTWSSTPSTPRCSRAPSRSAARCQCSSLPLDDNITSAAFELNNALNVSQGGGRERQADSRLAHPAGFHRPPQLRPAAAQGQARTRSPSLRRQLTGKEDSPVYGIKFAAIHDDYRLPDVSGALVPGERLHHRPFLGGDDITVPAGLHGAGSGIEASQPAGDKVTYQSSSSVRRSPAASRW